MTRSSRFLVGAAVAAGIAVAGALTLPALAGPEKIAFPQGYQSTYVSLGAIDRYDSKSVRTVYINRDAFAAFKAGGPLPDGTVLVLEQRPAKLGADGTPLLDAEGRFMPDPAIVSAVNVQAKKSGWGEEYPNNLRNGNWEFAVFDINGVLRTSAATQPCLACHKPRDKDDYTFMALHVMNAVKK